MKNLISTLRLIRETIKMQKELLITNSSGSLAIDSLCPSPAENNYSSLIKSWKTRVHILKTLGLNLYQMIRSIAKLNVYNKNQARFIHLHDIQDRVSDKMQFTMRKFAEENKTLEKENQWLKQVIQQERNYGHMLIKLNNATQNLFNITDRKVLLKTVTTALCEDLNFNSAVLWIHDKKEKKLIPISWSNVMAESLQELDIHVDKRPYSDLLNHRKSYFIVDDMDDPSQIDNQNIQHVHQLSRLLGSEAIFLIPIISVDNIEEVVENYHGETNTSAILMVGQKQKKRMMESKDLLQRYAYSIGLTLGHVDIYHFLNENYHSFKKQAVTDGLTGLYNRRFFNEELEREMQRSSRHQLQMSLILMDVDHFKKYNDTNGHQAGDDVLKKVGSLLREITRVCDMECRYGGEEFALILPETNKQQAMIIAEKLRKRVEETYFYNQEKQPSGNLTLSLGVSTFPDDSGHITELIEKADEGLYKAKEMGRNVVVAISKNEKVVSHEL